MYKFMLIAMMTLSSLQSFSAEGDTVSINDNWLFLLSDDAASVPRGVETATFDDSQWVLMKVPAHWRVSARHSTKNYVGTYRGWIKHIGLFEGRETILHLGNCTATASVWINGNFIGKTEPNAATKEFNITPYLKPGFNLYVIQLARWDQDDKVRDTQMQSGITSPCYLYGLAPGQRQASPVQPVRVSGGLINGVRARIADRNDLEPATGFIDSEARMLEDIRLLRRMNFNAVTFNKASSDPLFAKLATRSGLAIVTNGVTSMNKGAKLVDENRQLSAAGIAAWYANQDITVAGRELQTGKIAVTNGSTEMTLTDAEMVWELLADGRVVKKGLVPSLTMTPRQTVEISLPYTTDNIAADKELFLRTIIRRKGSPETVALNLSCIRPFSYPTALQLGKAAVMRRGSRRKPRLNTDKRGVMTIYGKAYSLQIDTKTGLISRYVLQGVEAIDRAGAVRPNLPARLLSLNATKPNKLRGVSVTAVFATDEGNLTWTYELLPTGVLTIAESKPQQMNFTFPTQLTRTNYYVWEQSGNMIATSVDELRSGIRWWKQTDGSGRGVQLLGNGEFYALPTTGTPQLLLHPGVQPFKLTFLPVSND